jgi:hypothetical protein
VCVCVCVCVCVWCVRMCVCVCVYAVCVCVYCRCTASDCWSALPPHGVGGKTLNLCVLYLLWLVSIFTFDMCSAPQSLTIYRVALFYSLVPTPKVYRSVPRVSPGSPHPDCLRLLPLAGFAGPFFLTDHSRSPDSADHGTVTRKVTVQRSHQIAVIYTICLLL